MIERITIVEDHGLMASTVAAALATQGWEVATVQPSAEHDVADVVYAVTEASPDLALLDLDLGDWGDAVPLVAPLRERDILVLVVTGVQDPNLHAACIAHGAAGVVDKGLPFDHLVTAIERTAERGTLLTEEERHQHLARLREHERERHRVLAPFERLSPREAEVLGELMAGHTVEEIAARWVVSKATVRTQVTSIRDKLGVSSQVAAIGRAREVGWVPPQERDEEG
jgi:two-component system, NarL family, nitrate/nitrite response regulator NarL